MKVPEYSLCKKCRKIYMKPWFRYKMDEWVDMDYPYSTFRPALIVCTRDLCQACREIVIKAFDRENAYPPQLSTDELEKAWKDCHGWGY